MFALSRTRALTNSSTGFYGNKVNPCTNYNNGTCSKKRDHDQLKHDCAYWYSAFNRCHLHPKVECMKLHGQPKQISVPPKAAKTQQNQTDNKDWRKKGSTVAKVSHKCLNTVNYNSNNVNVDLGSRTVDRVSHDIDKRANKFRATGLEIIPFHFAHCKHMYT